MNSEAKYAAHNPTSAPRSMKLRFPSRIKVVDEHTIEIEVKDVYGPVFDKGYEQMLVDEMGKVPAISMLEDAAEELLLTQLTKSIRIA